MELCVKPQDGVLTASILQYYYLSDRLILTEAVQVHETISEELHRVQSGMI